MEYIAGMTSRGRVTIPKAIWAAFEWQPLDKIHFTVEEDVVTLERVSPSQGETPDGVTDTAAAIPDIRRLEP